MNLNVLDFTTNNNHLQIQQQQQQPQHIQQQLFNSNMQPQQPQQPQQQQQAQIVLVNQTGASNPTNDMNADDFWYANLQLNNNTNHPNQFINIQQTQPHQMHQQQMLQQQQIHHIQPQQQQQHHIQLNELQLAGNNMLIMMPPPQQQQNQPASSSSSASSSAPASSSLASSSSMPQNPPPKNSSPTNNNNNRKVGKPRKNQTSTPIKSNQLQQSPSSSSMPSSSSTGSSSNTVANLINMNNQLNSSHSPAQSPSSVLLLSPSSSSSTSTQQQPVDPNAPKPPLTGYQHYFKLRQSELRSQDASLKFGDIVKIVGNEWSKNIDKETKDKFINRGLQDKERYKNDLKMYKQMNDGNNPPEMPHSEAAILPTTPNAVVGTPQKGKPGKKSSQQQQMQLQMQHALNGEIKMEVDSMVIKSFFFLFF